MKLEEIYKLGIEMAIRNDLRGAADVKRHLDRARKQYNSLSEKAKEEFDTECLINPYADSRIEYGKLDRQVKKVFAGIDVDSSEVLLADRIGEVDLIVAHHPEGRSLMELDEVMHLQAEVLAKYGVPINIAQGVLRERISEVGRKLHPENVQKTVDAARLLDIPLIIEHTTCDNLSASYIKKVVEEAKPETVSEVMEALKDIPEYKQATRLGSGPMIFAGSANNYCGKVVVTEFTGGTEGSKLMYERMAHAGIGTIISMHLSEESRKEADKHHLNVIVAGHISSDSLGMNLFLDELEKRGVEIVPAGGLIRVSRNKSIKKAKKSR